MSDKPKVKKSRRKKPKLSGKRKASKSPEAQEGETSVHKENDRTGTTSVSSVYTQGNVNTPLSDSERYVQSVLSFNAAPTMSFNQQIPYGYQTPQPQQPMQPNQSNQTPGVFMSTPMVSPVSPPGWAVQLMDDVKAIKATIPKIDKIEVSLRSVELKIGSIETKVTTLERKVQEIEQSTNFINTEFENQKTALMDTNNDVQRIRKLCKDIETEVKACSDREEKTADRIADLESRSMRENLVFYGIPEATDGQQHTENCEHLIKDLIATKLKIDPSNMVIDRAHRLGGGRARKPRPIVAKFHRYADRETVRTQARDATIKQDLKGSNLGVGIQSPKEYRDARKALNEYEKREKDRGHTARIIGNKLYVNNTPTKKFVNGNVVDM